MLIQLLTNKYPGMRLWLSQRLSAVIMAAYIVLLIIILAALQPNNHAAWRALFATFWMCIATWFFFLSLFIHAWLGVGDVFKDYVFNKNLRAKLQIIVDILLVIYLVWISFILWNIS
jgi:succinate dehydrogenase / fumarate reductase, membrane anchor subunit